MYIVLHSEKKTASKTGSLSVSAKAEIHLHGWIRFKVLIVINGHVLIYCCVFLFQFGSYY